MTRTHLLVALFAIGLSGCESTATGIRRYVSPSGNATLTVTGADDWPKNFWSLRTVKAQISVGDDRTLSAVLYDGDGLDSSFDAKYGEPKWVSSRVIRFPHGTDSNERWRVTVENRSGAEIPLVVVSAYDLHLIASLQRGEQLEVPTSAAAVSDVMTISAQVLNPDGTPISEELLNIPLREIAGGSVRFRVVITPNAVHILKE